MLLIVLVRVSTGLLLSCHIFFSSQKKNDLVFPRTTHNRQTSKNTRNKPGIQAQSTPRKRKEYQYIHFSKRWLPPFPPGSNCLSSSLASSLFSGLQLICRKTVFDEASEVGVWLSICVFFLKFEFPSTSKQPSTVVVVVVFFTLTDRASTIPSIIRGCQSGMWSAEQKEIRGTSTKLQ